MSHGVILVEDVILHVPHPLDGLVPIEQDRELGLIAVHHAEEALVAQAMEGTARSSMNRWDTRCSRWPSSVNLTNGSPATGAASAVALSLETAISR